MTDTETARATMQWFAPAEAYLITPRCPSCRAEPGQACTSRTGRPHAGRVDRGIRLYGVDVERAPWLEDREHGRLYSSPAVMAVWQRSIDERKVT